MENKSEKYINDIDNVARCSLDQGTTEARELCLKAKIAMVEIEFTKQQGKLEEEIKEMNKRSLSQSDRIKFWSMIAAIATVILAIDAIIRIVELLK